MVCGVSVWSVVCGVWCVEFECVECGVWSVWSVVWSVWNVSVWSVVCGVSVWSVSVHVWWVSGDSDLTSERWKDG